MRVISLCLAALLLCAAQGNLSAQTWNANLVVNGGAETGSGITSRSAAPVTSIPGWTSEGTFTVAVYGSAMLYSTAGYGPEDRGKNYFAGGPQGGKAVATQTIDLSSAATEIDAGRVRFYLSAWLSNGGTNSLTESKLTAAFQDASGKTMIEQALVASKEAQDPFLMIRAGSGFLLPNTRKVKLTLDLSRTPPVAFNTAGADNISLVLALEPALAANLVVNPGGEATKGEGSHNTAKSVPGWCGPEAFGVAGYATGNLRFTDPGPEDRGLNYFFTRTYGRPAEVMQEIDVTLLKDRIDANGVSFKLSAWVGGEARSEDASAVQVLFRGSGANVQGGQVGPVKAADRSSRDGLLLRSTEGPVPAGTRVITVRLTFTSATGSGHAAAEIDNIVLTLHAAGSVAIKENGILNAATLQPGPIAPGEMVTILTSGVNLAATTRLQLDSAGVMSTHLGEVRAYFDGTQAPLLYVNSSEVGAIAPYDLDGKSGVKIRVEYKGAQSAEVQAGVAPTAPGIFTQDGSAKGVGLIYNEGYVPNGKDTPAAEGSVVTFYWTGGGQMDPAGQDGRIEVMPLSRPKAPVTVKIGGKAADLVFAGALPYGWSGLLSAVVKVPAGVAGDEPVQAPIVISAGDASSPETATIWVKK